ncbi:anti-sigma factor [Solicola sp. PLA-1-18]|uniref:anti-sigma factor n=1 Tax=Solicola sp. PLA-1-18 TaxID=3380532 RepID=UPI003B775F08
MTIDAHTLLAPYAMDALDDAEREAFEAHLEVCEECREELAGFVETAARLGAAVSEAAPASLRTAVLQDAARTPQVRPIGARSHRRSTAARYARRGLLVAAVLTLVAGVGGFWMEHNRAEDLQADSVSISQVLAASDVSTASHELPDGGTMTVASSRGLDRAVVAVNDLPATEKGKVYQLWMLRGDVPVPNETFSGGAGGSSHLLKDFDRADAVAITVEPEGGSTSPTTTPIAVVNA